jgi:N-acetylmuramoyl-L-alanine amidase
MVRRSAWWHRAAITAILAVVCAVSVSAAVAATIKAKITSDTSEASTRVVVTFTRPVKVTVNAAAPGRIELTYAAPVDVSPEESTGDGAILKRWRVTGDRTVVLETGPAYRKFDSFELKNPPRFIVDLQGDVRSRAAVAPPVRKDAAAGPIVVIDPGHGGVEDGAVGPGGLKEKDVALDLARRLKAALGREKDVGVVLTRDDDRVNPLDERAAVANHNRAALFVSIHLNSAPRRGAQGAETYYLSPDATDDEARTLAALENRASGVEAPPEDAKGNADRGLDLVLWDLAQNQYLTESAQLAESVQRHMNVLTGTRDRGVRQAPFRVLMGATMPAILVEVGFLSTADEEARFKDSAYLDRVVEALTRAVREFLEGRAKLERPGRTVETR